MASISSVTMRGFGNSTFVGSASLVVTLGYGLGEAAVVLVNPSAIRIDLIGSASRFTIKGSPARAGTLEGSEARSG